MVELFPKVTFAHVSKLEPGTLYLARATGDAMIWHLRVVDPERSGTGWSVMLHAGKETLVKRDKSVLSYGDQYRIELPADPLAWFSGDAPPSLSIGVGESGGVLVAHKQGNDGDPTEFGLTDFSEAAVERRIYTRGWSILLQNGSGDWVPVFRGGTATAGAVGKGG